VSENLKDYYYGSFGGPSDIQLLIRENFDMQETVCIILNIMPEIYIHENTYQNGTFLLLVWGTQKNSQR
jgi:hypothetical protein